MPADTKDEMGTVLSCGRKSNKAVPKKGKTQPSPPPKKPKPYLLKTKVTSGGKEVAKAKVSLSGTVKKSDALGVSDFGKKAEGKYSITVTFDADSDYLDITSPIDLDHAKDNTIDIPVEQKNIVSAEIESEYKTIILDRKISSHQANTETKIVTDNSVCVQITFKQSNAIHQYKKKAKLTCAGAGAVDLFKDEACTTAFDGTIPNSDIVSGQPVKYYLRAKTKGKFNLTVTLEDPADTKIKLQKPKFEEPLNVCEVLLKVFQNDLPKIKQKKITQDTHPISKYHDNLKKFEIPEQIELSDSDKVKKGRFLHAQKDNNHDRAKIVLKIDTAQWPEETKDYQLFIVPTCASGSVEFFDKQWEGTKFDHTTPTKISDLKAKKGELVLWAEGKTAADKLNDIVVSVSLNRPAGGLTHKGKKHADWARFTVVKIEEIKLKYDAPASGVSAWDDAQKRFFINLKDDPDGRKIKIHAKLSTRISGVPLYFMLVGHKKNGKTDNWKVDMPDTWKWNKIDKAVKHKDRTSRDDVLHLQKDTNAEGEAEMELVLSRFGGDKFTPACYIHEDPHLAKFIDGHTDLEKRKPVMCVHDITIWRKLWYQLTSADGFAPPDPQAAEQAYQRTFTELVQANHKKFLKASHATDRTFYPEWMVKSGGGNNDVAVIGAHNKATFFSNYFLDNSDAGKEASIKKLKAHVLICEYQCDPGYRSDLKTISMTKRTSGWIQFTLQEENDPMIVQPALNNASLVVAGTWVSDTDPKVHGTLDHTNVIISSSRPGKMHAKVKLPATVAVSASDKVTVKLKLNVACGFLGESDGKDIMAVFDPTDVPDYNDTITHEIGHSVAQSPTPAARRNKNKAKPRSIPDGIPIHPETEDEGQGVHCYSSSTANCVMWPSAIATNIHRFCDMCQPYLLVQDMTKLT